MNVVLQILGGVAGGAAFGVVLAWVGRTLGSGLANGWGDLAGVVVGGAVGYLIGIAPGIAIVSRLRRLPGSAWLALGASLLMGALILAVTEPLRLNTNPSLLQVVFVVLPPIAAALAFSRRRTPPAG
jgi:hypothetical protein